MKKCLLNNLKATKILTFPDHVLRLKKTLYGLKQAPRAWYDRLTQYLQDRGFKRGYANRTLFVKNDEDYLLIAQVYVDDIVLFGVTIDARAIEFSGEMKKEFEMSMVGSLHSSLVFKSNKERKAYSFHKKNLLEI